MALSLQKWPCWLEALGRGKDFRKGPASPVDLTASYKGRLLALGNGTFQEPELLTLAEVSGRAYTPFGRLPFM